MQGGRDLGCLWTWEMELNKDHQVAARDRRRKCIKHKWKGPLCGLSKLCDGSEPKFSQAVFLKILLY